MTKNCKNDDCGRTSADMALEDSGYCFACAEEMACLLADAGFDTESAWR